MMEHRSGEELWTRLCRYAAEVLKKPGAIVPLDFYIMDTSLLISHLKRYQQMARLFHRDPDACRRQMAQLSDDDIEMLVSLNLMLCADQEKRAYFLSALIDEQGKRDQYKPKYSEMYRKLATEMSWRMFSKHSLKRPCPGDESVDYITLPIL